MSQLPALKQPAELQGVDKSLELEQRGLRARPYPGAPAPSTRWFHRFLSAIVGLLWFCFHGLGPPSLNSTLEPSMHGAVKPLECGRIRA